MIRRHLGSHTSDRHQGCVDVHDFGPPPPPFVARPVHHAAGVESQLLPMAATERGTGKRWALTCKLKPIK